MTKHLSVGNISQNDFPVFDPVESPKGAVNNILRSVSYKKGGIIGLVSSLQTQYLTKLKKDIQNNLLPTFETKKKPSDVKKSAPIVRKSSVPLFLKNSWEKHEFMNKVIPVRNNDSPQNFTTVEMARQGYSPPKKTRQKISMIENDTTTVVAINSSDWIVQPRFMETKGSMCVCEFWNERDKQKIAKKHETKIVNVTRKSAGRLSQSYIGLLRPEKMELTQHILKMLKEHKHGMDVGFTDLIRAKEQKNNKVFKIQKSNSVANISQVKKDQLLAKSQSTVNLPKVQEEAVAANMEETITGEGEKSPELSPRVQMNRIALLNKKNENMDDVKEESLEGFGDISKIQKTTNENNLETTKVQNEDESIIKVQNQLETTDMLPLPKQKPKRSESLHSFLYKKNLETFKKSKTNGSFRIKLLSSSKESSLSARRFDPPETEKAPPNLEENTFLNQSRIQVGAIQSRCKQSLDNRKELDK